MRCCVVGRIQINGAINDSVDIGAEARMLLTTADADATEVKVTSSRRVESISLDCRRVSSCVATQKKYRAVQYCASLRCN
jgi:hypothetical protein